MRLVIFIGLLAELLLSASCNNSDEIIVEPPGQTINTAINLTSIENLDPAGNTFEFRCLTDSLYGCANYSIDFVLTSSADSFDLTFTEITPPTVCLPAFAPAFAIVNIGSVPNGTYQFPITVNTIVAAAQLIVTDSTIQIVNGDSTWTNIHRPLLHRVPANLIWGQVGYNLAGDFDSANSYFDSLVSAGAVPETLSAGSYGYFYFDGSGNPDSILELGASIGTTFRIPYVYSYSGDTATLHSLITAYANQGNVVEVNVITSEGFEYRTW